MTVLDSFHSSGEIAALAAAFLWAVSSIWFTTLGKTIKPIELNLVKGIGGIFLLAGMSLFLGEQIPQISFITLLMLFVSGIIGIGFGDTMYFEALNSIGARLTLLITISAPPMTAILAVLFLNEKIPPLAWFGVLLTVLGIVWVVIAKKEDQAEKKKIIAAGIFFAFLAALTQAGGAVISRWALTQSNITALQSAVIRLFAGIIFLIFWMLWKRLKFGEWLSTSQRSNKTIGLVILVIVFGAFMPLWLQQVAFKNTEVGIAQTLLATSPLFVLPITAIQREKLQLREILGVLLALAGIALLFLIN